MQASVVTRTARLGFTLVELMVSASVLSILVLLFAHLFSAASNAWIAGDGNVERRRNARSLTDYIGGELKCAMLPVQTVNGSTGGNLQFLINPSSGQVPTEYRNADCLFWQAPLATETTYGDIAEMGYFVKWDETVTSQPRPVLCRFFVNPSITDSTGTISPNSNFLIFDPNPSRWLSGSLLDTIAPATKAKGYAGLFGENVVGLWVRSYGLDGQELPRSFDSRIGYTCQFTTTDSSGYRQSWSEKRYIPQKVVISIAQVDSHYASRLPAAAPLLRALTSSTSIHDAGEFLQAIQQQGVGSTPLLRLIPGLRTYSTEVALDRAQ